MAGSQRLGRELVAAWRVMEVTASASARSLCVRILSVLQRAFPFLVFVFSKRSKWMGLAAGAVPDDRLN